MAEGPRLLRALALRRPTSPAVRQAARGRIRALHTRLLGEAQQLRAEIAILRGALKRAHDSLNSRPVDQLVEANEHLVLAALHAQGVADHAVSEMGQLVYANQHDALCGIPNRALMHDRLLNAITLARRRGARLALLFIDLNNFKHINDTLGHPSGDEVLRQVARRLQAAVRDSDTVSRHGGDEFLVMLSEIAQADDAQQMAEKLHHALASPCVIAGMHLPVSASIGTAIYPDDGSDADSLIAFADAAMYAQKAKLCQARDPQWPPLPQAPDASG